MYLVVLGDPIGGFTFWGPFRNVEDAIDWAERSVLTTSWWIADLNVNDWVNDK